LHLGLISSFQATGRTEKIARAALAERLSTNSTPVAVRVNDVNCEWFRDDIVVCRAPSVAAVMLPNPDATVVSGDLFPRMKWRHMDEHRKKTAPFARGRLRARRADAPPDHRGRDRTVWRTRLRGRVADDPVTLIRTFSLHGQLVIFHVAHRSTLTVFGWNRIDAEKAEQIKSTIREHTRTLLEQWSQESDQGHIPAEQTTGKAKSREQ
jgi:hypothetical protein